VREIKTPTFRKALAVLQHAKLFMGCEGGMHHGAAAVGIGAVVLFGGFISPATTGYDFHANIFTGEGGVACGKIIDCEHCKQAMRAITVERVLGEARKLIASHRNVAVGQQIPA
jgi:ADP-heptose:LPS heptosyltransferase